MVQVKGTLKIQPTTLTDLTVTRSQYDQVINTLSLSDFTVQNDYLESNIKFKAGDEATISSTGYQTQTITVATSTFNNAIVLTPLEFSNIETNSIKYYCKDEVARNSITSITTDLSDKAGTDLANVTDSAKVMMSGMGMPSNRYIALTLGASGTTYTAPANGWIKLAFWNVTKAGYISIVAGMELQNTISYTGGTVNVYIPVSKGETFKCFYDVQGSNLFRFYYAVGSESEAS